MINRTTDLRRYWKRHYKTVIFQNVIITCIRYAMTDQVLFLVVVYKFIFLISGVIRNSSHYVRDFYFFKRNHTPKLRLKKMTAEDGNNLLQRNAFNLKFLEIGKVMFSYSILKHTPPNQVCCFLFLYWDDIRTHT